MKTTYNEYIDNLSHLAQVDIRAAGRQEIIKIAFDNGWSTDVALELIEACWIRQWEDYDNDCTVDQVIESFERVYGKVT